MLLLALLLLFASPSSDFHKPGFGPRTADIHEAARHGRLQDVKSILDRDITQLEARDALEATPLIVASTEGHVDVVEYLLEKGAFVNATVAAGNSSLHFASMGDHLDVASLLINAGADVGLLNERRRTPLATAVSRNISPDIVTLLVENGADLSPVDFIGMTPLKIAIYSPADSIVNRLLDLSAPLPTDENGIWEMAHGAAESGHDRLFLRLFSQLSPGNISYSAGRYLSAASKGGSKLIIDKILASGADPDLADSYGLAPIHHAARMGHAAVIQSLISSGASVDATMETGDRAIDLARRGGFGEAVSVLGFAGTTAQEADFVLLKGPYFGQTPPSNTPRIFARGIVSTSLMEHSAPVFTADGNEMYWTYDTIGIRWSRVENGRWTRPEMVPFDAGYFDHDPTISPDGRRMIFLSNRPTGDEVYDPDARIWDIERFWYVDRTDSGWSEPIFAGETLNASNSHWQPSLSTDGTLYFAGTRPGGAGLLDLYAAASSGEIYQTPVSLGSINSDQSDITPFISRDGSFVLFSNRSQMDGTQFHHIYISRRLADGSWGAKESLGPIVNGRNSAHSPVVSRDGKYLFFVRNLDVYWVRADAVGL